MIIWLYIYGMYTIYYILYVHYILYIVCTCIYYVFRIVFFRWISVDLHGTPKQDNIPSGHQTWLAGKSSIGLDEMPMLPEFADIGGRIVRSPIIPQLHSRKMVGSSQVYVYEKSQLFILKCPYIHNKIGYPLVNIHIAIEAMAQSK